METLDQLLTSRESPNDISSNDVESMWETFKTTLSNSMEKNIPSKLVSKKKNSRPWINTATRRSALRKKRKLYRKAKRSSNDEDWAQFRKFSRTLERRIRKQHRDYVSSTIGASLETNNSKPFWNYVKALNLTSFGITSLTKKTGEVVFTPQEKANNLNEQFQSVFTEENADRMPDLRTTTTPTLPPLVVSNAEVRSLLSRLDSNKAPGPDGIRARVLRQCANSISPALCRLFQASIHTGYLPHDWRSANITPIYKKGDRSDPSNYRPVSLTSIPSKILEHVTYRHLMTHLEDNAILSDAQHGFRKGRSCETQLLLLLENLTKTLDNRRQVDLILTDFSKAFDKVPHQRLLLKLKNFGVQGPILDWLTCFVTKRTQRVVLEGIKSEEVIVNSDVPQGTVLGPLLFLVFINDIHENVSSQLHLFADDCILYREVINIEDCNNLQRDTSSICDWESEWQLEFNAVKCFALRMSHKHIKLCPIVRLAKAKTMADSNLAPWEFATDPRVILVLLSAKVGRLSVVTIFTLPYPTVL